MENEKKYRAFIKKLQNNVVFFKNSFEGAAIKSDPKNGFFAKFAGEEEYPVKQETQLVTEALLEYSEITEAEYNKF